jgi:hypothetical protein
MSTIESVAKNQVPLAEMTAEQLKEQRARLELLGKKLHYHTMWARLAFFKKIALSYINAPASDFEFDPWENLTPAQYREAYASYILSSGRAEAERFLKLLDPTVDGFTFQTFDDSKAKRRALTRVFNGTLDQHWDKLCKLNIQGAGIFVTVNATDGKGRTTENIKRVRALFVDLDGAPLEPVIRSERKPHIIVASSPGHFHPYWLVSDVKLEEFADLQKVLIARFDGDPKVFDLPRVMRLPGFFHCKDEPFLSHIISTHEAPAYKAADFGVTPKQSDPKCDYFKQAAEASKSPTQKLNDAALANLAAWVPELFPGATPYHEGFRVSSANLGRELEEDISFRANGIKDFGLHDQDDPLEGKRTPVNIVMEHLLEVPVEDIAQRKNHDAFVQACDWLRERVGETEQAKASTSDIVPVDLWKNREAPPLPKGLLPRVIEEYAFTQAKLMGTDPAGIAMGALTVCAAAIPDHVQIQVKTHGKRWKESVRIWTALGGQVSAKKSPIMRTVIAPINRIEAKLACEFAAAMADYEELSSEEKKNKGKPKRKRIRMEDVTMEAVQDVMLANPDGVMLVRDELSGWFGSMDKYSGGKGDRSFWLQTFNGDPYSFDRVGRGTGDVENLSMTLLGGIQEDHLRKVVAEGVDDGLIQRLFVIMLRPAVLGVDEPLDDDRYDDLVDMLHSKSRNFFCDAVQFTDEAQVIRRQLEQKHLDLQRAYEKINKKLAGHIGKYDGLFARLCLLWHSIETVDDKWPSSVDAKTARRVADFLHGFLLKHAVAFYIGVMGLSDDNDRLAAVAGYILAHKLERITNRDIQRGDRSMRKMTRRDTNAIFEQLEAFGWIIQEQGKRYGDVQWVVNPEVHRKFATKAKEEVERRREERALIIASLPGHVDEE